MVRRIPYQPLMAMSEKQDPSTLRQLPATVLGAVAPCTTPHLRSLQNSNSQPLNSKARSALAAIFVVIFILGVVCILTGLILICMRCMNQQQSQQATGATRSTPNGTVTANHATTAGSATNGNLQEQPQRHVNAHLDIEICSQGLDRQQIEQQLVTRRYLNEENSFHRECAICLSPFRRGEEVAQSVNSECDHLFHTECIVDWLVTQPACPECRQDFLAF